MDLINTQDNIKNSNLLLLLAGVLLVEVINSIDYLLTGLCRVIAPSIRSLLLVSASFQAAINLVLIVVLLRIISTSKIELKWPKKPLSITTFKAFGFFAILVITAGSITNGSNKQYFDKVNVLEADPGNISGTSIAYLVLAQTGFRILSGIFLMTIYFVIAFAQKGNVSPPPPADK